MAFSEMSSDALMRLIGTAEAPVVLDVRTPEDFEADPHVVPTALRIAHPRVADALPRLAGRRAVVVCHRGHKLSHGAAALLRAAGAAAEALEGGMEAWRAAGLPATPAAAIPPGGLWVTRHRPKIDRIACPWLIRRFVQPDARFLFVPPAEVLGVAERFDATPFDIEGVPWSHRGENCTFDTMIEAWNLHSDALLALARVVRAADTNRHDLAPEAAGLLAISVGLSRLCRDDIAQLDTGLTLYDALYRWARDGRAEGHDWPAGRAA